MEAFLRAEERLERERLALELTLVAVGTQGNREAIERQQRELTRIER